MQAADLRVALVHWTAPPTTGGVESHLVDLARFLAARGAEVTILVGEPCPEVIDDVEIVTVRDLNLDEIRRREELRAVSAASRFEELFRDVFRHRQVNVVHGHNLHHFSPAPALALDSLRRTLGFKIFHTFHETWPDLLAENPVYASWDGNFAVSEHVQRECVNRLGFRPQLHRLGIDVSRFVAPERARTVGPARILHPARLLPWKGVHISVEMLGLLRGRGIDAQLIITDTQRIADWNEELSVYREQIIELARDLDVFDHIDFQPARIEDMPRLYEMADIVIYPTIGEEPYGLVPLEAMSCQRPVVASRSGGIPETVCHGLTGFLVEPNDPRQLAGYVETLIRDPQLSHRMALAGRRRVEQYFDGRRYAKNLVAWYLGEPVLLDGYSSR